MAQKVVTRAGIDRAGFTTALTGTFLEGLEAVFIVITFGLAAGAMPAVAGGPGALVVVQKLPGALFGAQFYAATRLVCCNRLN
ncbi:MAG: hypothetical protein M0Z41_14480 [Peptococcaceae bacterium]|nr:hypothetical protein [Peptococcaceae bacterium]